MDDVRRHVLSLVDGTTGALPPIEGNLPTLVRGASTSAVPVKRISSHIWSELSLLANATDVQTSQSSGAASALFRHVDMAYPDSSDRDRILESVYRTLHTDQTPLDVDMASAELADLLGFDQLDLVAALLAKPSATAAHIHKRMVQRAQGVGSAKEPLQLAPASAEGEVYPNVYSSGEHGSVLSAFGTKFSLPVGTQRIHESYFEEVIIPRSKPLPFRSHERLITLEEMDPLCRGAFKNYQTLNRLQSAVYPMAYKTNENLLVCAPTGAGKTDVAMLSVLQCIGRFARISESAIHVDRNAFKIVYVAPMKALVSEVVSKFSKRLAFLGLKVRELTGDMQLSRKEIAETQMIVTTPEKWDVVTRKPSGDGDLALTVRLLIIDEVHLLHEDRGAVIETIVARTQRLVESTQSMIRIVGLSATLPNFVDVADFLGVNRYRGLFYFGAAFRPVPLEQHFLGVRGKHGSALARTHLDRVTYEKVLDLVRDGHPVMVFVHTRKDTVKSAKSLLELGQEDDISSLLTDGRDVNRFEREVTASRNRELRELYAHGIGIHHAGMLRSDRDLSERLFASGATKVLYCTATLAWGVNLPAYAVVIKGTDVYDAEQGKMVDLGILDVLQIFGRAGRPQFEDVGVSYICTSSEKLSHYIDAITSAHPIESAFLQGLIDALNAEVALGSVSSIDDGISWLGYTYLFTRLRKAPMVYGLDAHDVEADPSLSIRRRHWILHAAKVLAEHNMVVLDHDTNTLRPTSLGRIASRYYLSYKTMAIFAERLRNGLREADALDLMSRANDFSQIALRDNEEAELTSLLESVPCEVRGGTSTATGKVNILLQAHISQLFIDDFALVSDGRYVAKNAGRILQALFDYSLDQGYATSADAFLQLSKAVDRRLWPFEHPLRQYTTLSADVQHRITSWADDLEIGQLRALRVPVLARVLHTNDRIASIVHNAAMSFPLIVLRIDVRPQADACVRLDIGLRRDFVWDERLHGTSLPLVVWVENAEQHVVYTDRITLRPQPQPPGDDTHVDLTLSVYVPLSPADVRPASETSCRVAWSSLHWLGAEGGVDVSLDHIVNPAPMPTMRLLDVPLLNLAELEHSPMAATLSAVKSITTLNAMQTQVFHTMAHSRANALLCAPYAAGKRTVALWSLERVPAEGSILIIEPEAQRLEDLQRTLEAMIPLWPQPLPIHVLTKAKTEVPRTRSLFVCTPDVAQALASRHAWPALALLLCFDLHRLDATYECAVMHVRRTAQPARMVATAVSCQSALSLARWLQVPSTALYTFGPSDTPYPVSLTLDTVDLAYSDTLVRAYVKPALDRMSSHATPALLWSPTRAQCFTAARELVARLATNPLPTSPELESMAQAITHTELSHLVRQGVAVWDASLSAKDRRLVEQLFDMGCLHAVLCAQDAAVPLQAALVVVLGTQYFASTTRQVQEYNTDQIWRMQRHAARPGQAQGDVLVLCQQSRRDLWAHQLSTPLPLESELGEVASHLLPALMAEVVAGRVQQYEQAIQWLATSFWAERIHANPLYYGEEGEPGHTNPSTALSRGVDAAVEFAQRLGLLVVEGQRITATRLGTRLPSDQVLSLVALAHQALHWHTISDAAHRAIVATPFTEDVPGLEASCAKIMLEAVQYQRPSREDEHKDNNQGSKAPVQTKQSTTRLVLAQWLTAQLGGRSLRDLQQVLVDEAGTSLAARVADVQETLLLELTQSPNTRR